MPDPEDRESSAAPGPETSQGAGSDGDRIGRGGRDDEYSFLQLTNVLLRHRKVVLRTPIVVVALIVGVSLVLPRSYTTTASFTPQSGEAQASRLAGLASQFGISIPQGSVSQSPQFYADLLRSRELLRETVVTSYVVSEHAEGDEGEQFKGDLVDLLGVDGETPREAVAKAVQHLPELISISTSPETGVVELTVTTHGADLSRQVAARMIELVNRFNLETRKTQAAAERGFIEGQVAKAESALQAAEDSLKAFLEQNRRYQGSPELRFEYERLQRRVDLRQQVFTSLSQSLEQAKIDEVRNTPVITVVQPPERPARPDPRRLMLKGGLGLMLGAMLGVFWALGQEMLAFRQAAEPDHYAEFGRLRRQAVEDARAVWDRIRRMLRRASG